MEKEMGNHHVHAADTVSAFDMVIATRMNAVKHRSVLKPWIAHALTFFLL